MSAQSNIQQEVNNAGNSQQQENGRTGNQQARRSKNNSASNNRRVNQRENMPIKALKGPKGVNQLDPNIQNSNIMMNNNGNNMNHSHHHKNNQNGNYNNNINNQFYPQNYQNKNNKYNNRRNNKVHNNYNSFAPINPFKFNQTFLKQEKKAYIDLKKTKMCANFASGNCMKGDQCSFAHSEAELKQKPDLNKTKLCEEFEKNKVCNNESCCFAHGIDDLRHTDDFYKTSLCFNFSKEGKCENGDKCRYAHGENELKKRNNFDQKVTRKRPYNNGRKNKYGMMMNNQTMDPQFMKSTSLSAIKTKQNLDDFLDQEDVDLKKLKRSRLMNKEVMDWAKKRSFSAIKKQYVHYPSDLKKIQEIKNVFLQIDKDGSRSLDKDEINEMFSKYDFYIDPDYLDQLFGIVDDDQDNALNWQEFKKCALNDNATRVFNFMMRKARERANQNKKEKRPIQVVQDIRVEDMDNYEQYEQALLNQEKEQKLAQLITIEETPQMQLNYIPLRFLEVISYLSYLSNRDEILDKVNKTNEIKQKFKVFQDLLNCNKDYSDSYMSSKKQEIELLRQRRSISVDKKQKQRITIRNFQDLSSFLSRMTVVPFDANQRRQQNQFQSEPIPLDYKERKPYVRSTTLQQEQSFTKLLANKSEKQLKIPQHLLSLETMKQQQVSNLVDADKSISKLLQQNEKIKTDITKNQFAISDRIKFFVDQAKEKYNLSLQQIILDNNSKNQNYILHEKQEKLKYPEINTKTIQKKDQPRPNSTEKSNLKQNLDKHYSYFNRSSIKEKLKTIGFINEDNSEFNDHEISQNNLNSKSINSIKDDLLPSQCVKSINQINKINEEKLKKSLGFQNYSKLIGQKIRYQTPPRISIVYNKKVDSNPQQNYKLIQQQEQTTFNGTSQQSTYFHNQKINQCLEKINQQKSNPTLITAKRIFGSSQSIKRHINSYSSTKLKNQNFIKGEQIPAKQVKLITKWIETVSVSQNENLQNEFNI
ncbi:hypothetical protein ABPG72_008310 [Tetrahymena utriculariae]